MATTVGTLKTDSTTGGAYLSVTLDASPAILAGDVIVWASGLAGTNEAAYAPADWYKLAGADSTNAAQACGLFCTVAVGGEEGDTLTAQGAGVAGFCAVRVFRPAAGRKLDAYGIPAAYTDTDAGTGSSFTLTNAATTTSSVGLVVVRAGSGLGSATTSWDGAAAGTPEHRIAGGIFDFKLYSAADTPDVVAATLGSANKAAAFAVLQEIPTNTVIPYL